MRFALSLVCGHRVNDLTGLVRLLVSTPTSMVFVRTLVSCLTTCTDLFV